LDKTSIGHLSYIGDSVIGEECNLGAGSITANYRFDGKTIKMVVKQKIIDSGKEKFGIIMGDGVKTGIHTSFMPGVKIGSRSYIGPNLLVYQDVPSNTLLHLKQKIENQKIE
jgi:bifunctional UDP-N-acetylglucosamine pyrophosphorylase/glucosamine-1-phosphate N-acetyltransferase